LEKICLEPEHQEVPRFNAVGKKVLEKIKGPLRKKTLGKERSLRKNCKRGSLLGSREAYYEEGKKGIEQGKRKTLCKKREECIASEEGHRGKVSSMEKKTRKRKTMNR